MDSQRLGYMRLLRSARGTAADYDLTSMGEAHKLAPHFTEDALLDVDGTFARGHVARSVSRRVLRVR